LTKTIFFKIILLSLLGLEKDAAKKKVYKLINGKFNLKFLICNKHIPFEQKNIL